MTFATERILWFQVSLLWFQKHMWYYIKHWINLWKQFGYDVFQIDSPSYNLFSFFKCKTLPYGVTLQLFLEALTLLDVCHLAPPRLRWHLICQEGKTRQKKGLPQSKHWKNTGKQKPNGLYRQILKISSHFKDF